MNKRWTMTKTLIGLAALVGALSSAAAQGVVDGRGDCPQALAEAAVTARHATHAPREISVEQAARFGLVLPCRMKAGANAPERQAEARRQQLAELEQELAHARARGERGGFRPELYGLNLAAPPVRMLRVAATPTAYDGLVQQRPVRFEAGG